MSSYIIYDVQRAVCQCSSRSPRWRQRRRKSTSGFSFGDVSHLRTSKSKRILTLAKIVQYAAEILLFPVSENKRQLYWNSTSGSTSVSVVIDMCISVGIPNFVQIGPSVAELWRHSHFQHGGHSVGTVWVWDPTIISIINVIVIVISAPVVIIVVHPCYIWCFGLNSFSVGVCSFLFLFVDVLIAATCCILANWALKTVLSDLASDAPFK